MKGVGVRPPSRGIARHRAGLARQAPVFWSEVDRSVVFRAVEDVLVEQQACGIYAVAVPQHLHHLFALDERRCDPEVAAEQIVGRCRQIAGCRLSKAHGVKGRHWFSRGFHLRRVRGGDHLRRLLLTYLPAHREQGGLFCGDGRIRVPPQRSVPLTKRELHHLTREALAE